MNIYVVAEGVEMVEQLNWLRGNGIAFAQGYLLGRPGEDTVFSELDKSRLAIEEFGIDSSAAGACP